MNYAWHEPENARWRRSAPPRSQTRRIVIAEDEALPAELLKRTLTHLGHLVVASAQDGTQAIALTRQWKPDAVVMDLRMPVLDGWSAMAELTREGLAPIVAVSALDDRESFEQAVLAGASAYLTKPVREDDLERALELAIAHFAQVQELRQQLVQAREQAHTWDDLTRELEKTKANLAIAARRAANAGLARGLTHEINNALTPIIGNAQILALLQTSNPEGVERTDQIIEYARRIAGWTALFRELVSETDSQEIEFSFNGLARDVFESYAERFRRVGISVQLDLDGTLPALRGNPAQIHQLLLLLVQNSMEAMSQGGEIAFRSSYDATSEIVEATLSDSGAGIAPEHRTRLFEPGFTTKSETTHTLGGWGLYTTLQIVQAHGGSIDIASPNAATGQGTTVRIHLPLQHDVAT